MQKKWLLSLGLNFILVWALWHQNYVPKTTVIPKVAQKSFVEQIELLEKQSYNQLLCSLLDTTHVYKGYRVCDLALGILVKEFDFDGPEHLPQDSYRMQTFTTEKGSYPYYPHLKENTLQSLHQYGKSTRFPLTLHGFIKNLEKKKKDPQYISAFFFHPKTSVIKRLFPSLPPGTLAQWVSEVGMETIEKIWVTQSQETNLSQLRQRILYYSFFVKKSPLSGYLLVLEESDFVLQHFSDQQLLVLLQSFTTPSQILPPFLLQVVRSKRSSQIQTAAYYVYCKIQKIPFDRSFLQSDSAYCTHVVGPGDTLESIAAQYQTQIAVVRKANQIKGQRLPKLVFIPKDRPHP